MTLCLIMIALYSKDIALEYYIIVRLQTTVQISSLQALSLSDAADPFTCK